MQYFIQKDRFSPLISRNNLLTLIYVPVLIYLLQTNNKLYQLGKYKNWQIPCLFVVVEIIKYYMFRCSLAKIKEKLQKRTSIIEKILKAFLYSIFMLWIYYITSVLLGAPFLSNFEETIMFSLHLTVLSVFPVFLHFEVNNFAILLDLLTEPPKDTVQNMVVFQMQMTLLGAWLGAVPIPLDWDREWQIWPTTCVLGSLCGFYASNVISFILQNTDLIGNSQDQDRFKNML